MPGVDRSVEFYYTVSGRRQVVLSVGESEKLGLQLFMHSGAQFFDPSGTYSSATSPHAPNQQRITHSKYSVHPSSQSPERINQIKLTIGIEGSAPIERIQMTKALKHHDRYALIFSRRVHVSEQPSRGRAAKKQISLGSFDARNFSPVFTVFVGNKERVFQKKEPDWCRITQLAFKQFRLVIVHMYVIHPLLSHGMIEHIATMDPRSDLDDNERLLSDIFANGFGDGDVLDFSRWATKKHARILADYIRHEFSDDVVATDGWLRLMGLGIQKYPRMETILKMVRREGPSSPLARLLMRYWDQP